MRPVVLRDVAGCDYAEIGLILRIPPGTVRSRIARGRARLAEAIGANGGNHNDGGERRTHEANNRDRDDRVDPRNHGASSHE